MQATVDAQALHDMALAGEFGDALVSGPLAFDGALVRKLPNIKELRPAAGYADIILVPFIGKWSMSYTEISSLFW